MSSENGADKSADKWFAPVPDLSIDSRGFCGPVWSPDGTKMAAIYEGVLAVWAVAPSGEPLGPPRHITSEIAYSPSWAGDSEHILYQSLDKLKTIDIVSGETKEIPFDLKYTPSIPKGRVLVHVGKLVDGKSQTARNDVDILIEGNRIKSVGPHSASVPAGARVIDASNLTAMPGLVEYHSHLQKDFGEAEHRAWLAFGVTTVRCPGDTPYEIVEDREANAFDLHGELETYVMAGMTPYEALKTATVNAADALDLDAGSIEPGKLADIVIVEGNPLENIASAHKVKRVIANGRLYELDDLLKGNTKSDRAQ